MFLETRYDFSRGEEIARIAGKLCRAPGPQRPSGVRSPPHLSRTCV
jgi:hypothetical protein